MLGTIGKQDRWVDRPASCSKPCDTNFSCLLAAGRHPQGAAQRGINCRLGHTTVRRERRSGVGKGVVHGNNTRRHRRALVRCCVLLRRAAARDTTVGAHSWGRRWGGRRRRPGPLGQRHVCCAAPGTRAQLGPLHARLAQMGRPRPPVPRRERSARRLPALLPLVRGRYDSVSSSPSSSRSKKRKRWTGGRKGERKRRGSTENGHCNGTPKATSDSVTY